MDAGAYTLIWLKSLHLFAVDKTVAKSAHDDVWPHQWACETVSYTACFASSLQHSAATFFTEIFQMLSKIGNVIVAAGDNSKGAAHGCGREITEILSQIGDKQDAGKRPACRKLGSKYKPLHHKAQQH